MPPWSSIQAALDARLANLIDSPPVAWDNTSFTPQAGILWLSPHLLPGEPGLAGLGEQGLQRLRGIYQVNLFTPAGQGTGAASQLVDRLCALFPPGLDLSQGELVITCRKSGPAPAQRQGLWRLLPLRVWWWCFCPRASA